MWYVSAFSVGIHISFLLAASSYAAESRPKAGEIVSVEGTVFVRPDGKETAQSLKPAKSGDSVYEGDVLNSSQQRQSENSTQR